MAGRPVAARGGNGMLYGLITFVVLTMGGIGAFVWQLTGNKELQSQAERARSEVRTYGSPPAYYREEARARSTAVFNVMNKDLQELARLTCGKEDAVRPAIVTSAGRILRDSVAAGAPISQDDYLLGALSKLLLEYKRLSGDNERLTAELAQARQAQLNAEKNLATVREEFEDQIAELGGELEGIADQSTEQLAAKDEQLALQQAEADAIGEELSRARVVQQTLVQDHEIAMHRVTRDLEALQDQIAVLKPGGFDPYDILTKADGRVLRAIPGSDVIYINLGQRDRIKPGMTFEVFSTVESESRGDFRGKASVEVTAVMETTAECLVTRETPNRPIVENDVIVNIAYEQNRLPKFVVRGEFDLDHDGETDWNGVANVSAIIQAWGGQVVNKIDETTDFVVIGMGPQAPEYPGDRPVSPVFKDLADSRLDDMEEFQSDIEHARTLYIPIITSSQFLHLTGFSGQGSPVLN